MVNTRRDPWLSYHLLMVKVPSENLEECWLLTDHGYPWGLSWPLVLLIRPGRHAVAARPWALFLATSVAVEHVLQCSGLGGVSLPGSVKWKRCFLGGMAWELWELMMHFTSLISN